MAHNQPVHRASALKQKNKKHHTLGHRTKGQLAALAKGRINSQVLSRRQKNELSRQERRHRAKQIRSHKREKVLNQKRQLGSGESPPFLVTILSLSSTTNPRNVLMCLCNCEESANVTNSPQGICHISSLRYKQRFSFVIPPLNDLYAILDTIKASDTVMLVWRADEDLAESSELLLSCIMAQGMPTLVHVVDGVQDLPQKKQQRHLKELQHEICDRFSSNAKLFNVTHKDEALLLLRQIGAQKQNKVFFRDHRAHLMAEKLEFESTGVTGTLKVWGYIRGQALNVNSLVHIPGWGDFQMNCIEDAGDPHPLRAGGASGRRAQGQEGEEYVKLPQLPEPELQESLTSTLEIDPMEGEQTWPTEEELAETQNRLMQTKQRKKLVPKGTSEYQANWIVDSESEGGEEEDDISETLSDFGYDLMPGVGSTSMCGESEMGEEGGDSEEYETMTMTDAGDDYDAGVDYNIEMEELQKLREIKDDEAFPDEIDTPLDTPARIRFQKYRGLQSFRATTWDPKENLPVDYARIFQFDNFLHAKKKAYYINTKVDSTNPHIVPPGSGWYVVVHIRDVPSYLYQDHIVSQSPLLVYSLLPHEQKMSLINVAIKSHPLGHVTAIKSKQRLIFQVGFRRFANCPIFSEHSTANKHKFQRFFHPGNTLVASMFAPITFPPAPVLVFKQRGTLQDLVATGSVYTVDPNRVVCKRLVLSGHPFKINRKSAIIRYMFFNPEDINWFKPVELRTKWGRRGHIKDSVGTHGHMKCVFNGHLKSQDTVLMNLYKRVFPKWMYDPCVVRPGSLMQFKFQGGREEEEEKRSSLKEGVSEEGRPPCKSAKRVHFAGAT